MAPAIGPVTIPQATRLQILIEPRHGLIETIDLVFRFHEHVTFTGINDEPGWDTEGLKSVPEFVGLRGGALRVAFAGDYTPTIPDAKTRYGLFVVNLATKEVRQLIDKELKSTTAW